MVGKSVSAVVVRWAVEKVDLSVDQWDVSMAAQMAACLADSMVDLRADCWVTHWVVLTGI